VDPGAAIGTLPTPERGWCDFEGWFTAREGGTKITPETRVTSDNVTYYAHWTLPETLGHQGTWVYADLQLKARGDGEYDCPIILDPGEGDGKPQMTTWVSGKDYYTVPSCPFTRSGYYCSGWKIYDACCISPTDNFYTICRDGQITRVGGRRLTDTINGDTEIYTPGMRFAGCGRTAFVAQWKKGSLPAKPKISCESSYTIVPGETCSIPVTVLSSVKKTTVTVKGLPAGLKYSGGTITGKAKKPGTSKVTITAKNSKGTSTKKITIKAKNPGFAITVKPQTVNGAASGGAGAVASGGTVTMRVGFKQTLALSAAPGASGVSSSDATLKVTGLPSGLSFSNGKITGVPRSAGTKTVTVKCSNKWGWSKTFSFKIKTTALPASVVGTFNGYTTTQACDFSDEWYVRQYGYTDCTFDYRSRAVKVSATSGGKLSAKIGSTAWTGQCWTLDGNGRYNAEMKRTDDNGTRLYVTVDPSMAWNTFQLTGYMTKSDGMTHFGTDWWLAAQRNPFGKDSKGKYKNAEAGKIVTKLVKYGTMKTRVAKVDELFGSGYPLDKGKWYELFGEECQYNNLQTSMKVSSSGVVTISGKVGGQNVSGTATLRISPTNWIGGWHRTFVVACGYCGGDGCGFGWMKNPDNSEYDCVSQCRQADFCLGNSTKPVRMHVEFSSKYRDYRTGWATIGNNVCDAPSYWDYNAWYQSRR
jgi:uncharacterized repeat protein (TIGR02543 family)